MDRKFVVVEVMRIDNHEEERIIGAVFSEDKLNDAFEVTRLLNVANITAQKPDVYFKVKQLD